MNKILFACIAVCVLTACKKDNSTEMFSGQVVKCKSTFLYGNKTIALTTQTVSGAPGSVITTTTDAVGNFTFTYSSLDASAKYSLGIVEGNLYRPLMFDIPANNLPGIKIYDAMYQLVVSLNVQNPYTSSDTLLVSFGLDFLKLRGPFRNGRLAVSPEDYVLGTSYISNSTTLRSGLIKPGGEGIFNKSYEIPRALDCADDSVYVSLDIR